jgi:hypothetical protein
MRHREGGVADVETENNDVGNEGKVIEDIKNKCINGIVRKGGEQRQLL